MFILDTNVLSAIMSARRVEAVSAWMAAQSETSLFTTTICQAEILAGIALLPAGRRRDGLDAAARAIFQEDFGGRVLPFDDSAARSYGALFAYRKQAGRPPGLADLMIAAIASAQGATLVTRNIKDFEGCGLSLINPWDTR